MTEPGHATSRRRRSAVAGLLTSRCQRIAATVSRDTAKYPTNSWPRTLTPIPDGKVHATADPIG